MASLLSRIFKTRHDDTGSRTASLGHDTRHALVSVVESALKSNSSLCGEAGDDLIGENVDQVIEDTIENLKELEERETFIFMRVQSYRKLLDKRAKNLEEASSASFEIAVYDENGDVDGGDRLKVPPLSHSELMKQKEQQKQYEEELSKVVQLQKSILVQIELSRRKVADLRKKKENFDEKREECLDFLMMSAEIDTNNLRGKTSMNEEVNNLLGGCNIEEA